MRAVLRLWWTFLTAVPSQRRFGVVGSTLFGLALVVGLLLREWIWLPMGFAAFAVFAALPALFTAPALFRSLSAPRMFQLLPHLRLRILTAVSLVLCALLVLSAGVLVGPTLAAEREFLTAASAFLFALGVVAAFIVALFLVLFLAFGDWRWSISLPLALVALVMLGRAGFLPALPAWVWPAAALGAWAIFAAWYLRVRQVRPVTLMPQQRAVRIDTARPVPRAVAIRTLLVSNALPTVSEGMNLRTTPLRFFVIVVALVVLLTGMLPLAFMLFFGERSVAIVRQSRLLWLNIPGSREAVRREIEKLLWRALGFGAAFLVVVAAILVSPLVGADARVLLGLAMTAGAAIYGTYVGMAAVPSAATYFWGFGSMAVLQLVLLVSAEQSLAAVAVVTAVELVGAALLRMLAIRRWRNVDWLRLRPLPTLAGVPRSP